MNSFDGIEITLDEFDDQLGVKSQLDSQERAVAVKAVAEEARVRVNRNIASATSEVDFLRWNRAMLYCTSPEMIDWMWDYGGIGVDDLLSEYLTEDKEKELSKETNYLLELKEKLSRHPSKDGMVKIALKRIREKIGERTIFRYRVLAEFPTGHYVKPTYYEWPEERDNSAPHIIYFEPENACVVHPCDDLFKASRNAGGVAYLQAEKYTDIIGRINGGHYMSGRDDSGDKITQDPSDFVLFALIGGFTNELRRVRISDLWNRQSK